MKKTYYLFNPGRISRRDNTLMFTAVDELGNEQKPRYLPVEVIEALYIFGSIDANSALFNFLGKQRIPVHFFDYYEHYTGTFQPKEYLLAGKMQVEQTRAYLQNRRRMHIARQLVESASFNMLKNMRYYAAGAGRWRLSSAFWKATGKTSAPLRTLVYHTQLNPTISFLHEPGTRRDAQALPPLPALDTELGL